jgi:hypothetical protein
MEVIQFLVSLVLLAKGWFGSIYKPCLIFADFFGSIIFLKTNKEKSTCEKKNKLKKNP